MKKQKRITIKKVAITLLAILIIIQFFRIDKTNLSVDANKDFATITKAPVEVVNILKVACYDCHSNESIYPWYTNIAPLSWWIKGHINDGRKHLNFSEWANYNDTKQAKKLKGCVKEINEVEMPLSSYTIIHKDAVLSAEQQKVLVEFLKSIK